MGSNIIHTDEDAASEQQFQLPKHYFYLLLAIIFALLFYIFSRQIEIKTQLETAEFYQNFIKGYQLDQSWVMTAQQLRREKKIMDRLLIERGNHQITRQELGRQSWGILHMITTTVPQHISPEMREQFNAFLILFAKFYPCKLCANYFIRTLSKVGQFQGETRMQLMDYMCNIHNRVNKRLKKRVYDCDMVSADWGTCDCFSNNIINSVLQR